MATGGEVTGWSVADVRPLHTSNPGRVFRNLMIVSLPAQGAQYDSTPADVQAYDVRTGKLLWVFHSIPHPGEFGYDTWPPEHYKSGGGVHNWSEFTVDEENGIAFIGFGSLPLHVGGLLLIGCASLANLLIARAVSRSSELVLRAALGAGRGRLIRQVIDEAVGLGVLEPLLADPTVTEVREMGRIVGMVFDNPEFQKVEGEVEPGGTGNVALTLSKKAKSAPFCSVMTSWLSKALR